MRVFSKSYGLMMATALAFPLAASPAWTQEDTSCPEPDSEDYVSCMQDALTEADVSLEFAYLKAQDMARLLDEYPEEGTPAALDVLAASQQAWDQFRRAGCAAESLPGRGRPEEARLFFECALRVTAARTETLNTLGSVE